jgi:hypothetical protein
VLQVLLGSGVALRCGFRSRERARNRYARAYTERSGQIAAARAGGDACALAIATHFCQHTHRQHVVSAAPKRVQRFAALQVARKNESDSSSKEQRRAADRTRYSVPEKAGFSWLMLSGAGNASGWSASRVAKSFCRAAQRRARGKPRETDETDGFFSAQLTQK